MILIKYKGKRTPIYIPRNGEGTVEYATDLDIQELDDKIQKTNQSLHGLEYALEQATETFNDFVEEYDRVSEDWATEQWVTEQLSNVSIPTVTISTENANSTTPVILYGDLEEVVTAIKNKTPYIAYFNNQGSRFGKQNTIYQIQCVNYNSTTNSGEFFYHTELSGGSHMEVSIYFRNNALYTLTRDYHYYATEDYVTTQINNTLGTLNNELEEILN